MNKLFETISKIEKVSNNIKSDLIYRKEEINNIKTVPIQEDDISFFSTVK